jgi:hypothetical protein
MTMRKPMALLLLLALAATSCGGGGDDAEARATVAVFKSLGRTQCTGGGTTAAALQNALINAGVQVVAASCGTDGSAQPAVCGSSDGAIAVFDVALGHESIAQALGFALLASLPAAQKLPCS